ncbi:MAG: chemotaxis protein CheW [Lysobacter sp.]
MSTMMLIDDYLDALLDGGTLVEGIPLGNTPHDGMPHGGMLVDDVLIDGGASDSCPHDGMPRDRRPAGIAEAAMAAVVEVLRVEIEIDAEPIPASAAHPTPAPIHDAMAEPAPVSRPAFVPALVPTAPPPVAALTIATPTATAHAPPTSAMATSHRWLRVAVGNDSYALELLRVQEVVRLAPIVALRGAARAVLGVMNLRGRIVPVLDLGLWLDAGCVHGDERSRIVVIERDDEMIGVLVSAVEDVVTLGRERIEPPLASSDAGAIVGIARVGATPTVLLDANALFG